VQPDKETMMVDEGWAMVGKGNSSRGQESRGEWYEAPVSLSMLITEVNVNHDRPGAGRQSR